MTTCNKFPALFFFLLALLCLYISPVARAWTTNAFGYFLFSYDELDALWSDEYEQHTGEEWPGLSEYLNKYDLAGVLFRHPLPHIIGRFSMRNTFTTNNAFQLVSLNSDRSFLFNGNTLRSAWPEDIPNMSMYSIADASNLVDVVVNAIDSLPCTTNDSPYPLRRRTWEIQGVRSRTHFELEAGQFRGYDVEVKTVPFPWSGFWAGWFVDVLELIDNGVNPSIFGSYADATERNLLWPAPDTSIYGAFSNINVSVKHRWK